MSQIVTLKADPHSPRLVYLCTRPELASTMGGFGPARFIGTAPPVPGASYVVELGDLDRFRVYCMNRGVSIVDTRESATRPRPAWAEARLPECRECGQPRARYANPTRCPQCGEAWVDA